MEKQYSSREHFDEAREKSGSVLTSQVVEIDIDKIGSNPWQPRKTFRKVSLEELAADIKQRGVLQPITVRRSNSQSSEEIFQIVVGERRLRASQIAGLTKIPAIIKETPDSEMATAAIAENIHREDMTFLDTIRCCVDLKEVYGSAEEVAAKVTKDRKTVERYCRTYEEIYSLPDFAALFEQQALSIDRTTADDFARVAADIRRLQKSNKREYDRIYRRLAANDPGKKKRKIGIKENMSWLLAKFNKPKNNGGSRPSSDGMFKETEREIVLHIKLEKEAKLPVENAEHVRASINAFIERFETLLSTDVGKE